MAAPRLSYYCSAGLHTKVFYSDCSLRYVFNVRLSLQGLIDQLVEDVKHVRPAVEKTRPNVAKNPDVDRLEEDVNRMAKRWGNCCMQVLYNYYNADTAINVQSL